MDNGDINNHEWARINASQGYGPLATDIGRALFGYRWGEHVGPLLFYVVERSWQWRQAKLKDSAGNWPGAVPCPINFSQLARLWGIPKQRIYEARDWLLQAHVLVKVEGGFMVNKDACRWTNPKTGNTLLRPEMLA